MKRLAVDHTELRERLHRERASHRGHRFFDLGDRELSDADRARMLEALHATSGFNEYPFQDTVGCVGRAASREGKSFDESLNSYYMLYVEF
jgi:hypothetical protein